MIELTINDFDSKINSENIPVIVDFWATWCGPCRAQTPILEQLQNELGDTVKIFKVNVDNEPELAKRFGVMSIPTLIFFKNGKQVDKTVGLKSSEELKTFLSSI